MSPDSSARSQVADVQAHVRIAGHRVALVPKAPFVLTPTDEGVEVVHRGMLARLRVVGDSLRYVVDGGARGLHDLMAAVDTDYAGPFRLETSDFVCAWPDGFRVASPDREGPFLFDLLPEAQGDEAGAGCLVFVAGPYAPELCPSVDALVTAGRALLAREDHETHSVVEVAYEHRGVPQRQWHARFGVGERIFVLTAQGPEDAFDAARAAAQQMVSSLRV
ncbi:MAG: hypothetical protein R3B40_27655 [Polyangiales bacterium]|nr:hypothetical protein [Myxococcales bacterium]MCB9656394.1 hypothetical protein [Sandaracinaceae bacterium]